MITLADAASDLAALSLPIMLVGVLWCIFFFLVPFMIWDISKHAKKTSVNTERTLQAIIHLQSLIIAQQRPVSPPPVSTSPSPPVPSSPRPAAPYTPRKATVPINLPKGY